MTTPYENHLCAQDPTAFAAGFAEAAWMVARWPRLCARVHQLMTTHIGKLPWPVLGIFHETPHDEGLLLGIFGLVANELG
jgi:hypothetical protein